MKKIILLICLLLGMCSTSMFPQEKEFHVENDGFEWYEVKRTINGLKKIGAEDRYGNLIIPLEYDEIRYTPFSDPLSTGFQATKGKHMGWYNKSGKCIIPYIRKYTFISKDTDKSWGTYYYVLRDDGIGICDRKGKEIVFIVGVGLCSLHPKMKKTGKQLLYYYTLGQDNNKKHGIVDANGIIVVSPIECTYQEIDKYVVGNVKTTNNPFKENRCETIEEIEGQSDSKSETKSKSSNSFSSNSSSSSSSSSNSGNSTTTIVVEQHGPVQVWVPCGGCQLSPGRCSYCNGSGWGYNNRLCSRCGGNGKCTICGGTGGHNEVQYR